MMQPMESRSPFESSHVCCADSHDVANLLSPKTCRRRLVAEDLSPKTCRRRLVAEDLSPKTCRRRLAFRMGTARHIQPSQLSPTSADKPPSILPRPPDCRDLQTAETSRLPRLMITPSSCTRRPEELPLRASKGITNLDDSRPLSRCLSRIFIQSQYSEAR